ncbi:MAG TPA: archease [Bryobacteraceae bacterium]|nr:archease [Bryobacteraceae bacterium]
MEGRSFEILEHPADIGFRAFGGTLAELFANAALALLSIADEPGGVEGRQEYPLEAGGSDYESLLVAWLSEVLYWFDGKRVGFREFRVISLEPTRIEAIGRGEPGHGAKLIVKAVTWHQLRVAATPHGWVAEVYLDI